MLQLRDDDRRENDASGILQLETRGLVLSEAQYLP